MTALVWTGIAIAVVLAAVFAWSRWRGPRIRPSSLAEWRRTLKASDADDLAYKLERVTQDRDRYRIWHWNHCDCHDSWDKCECASAGHPRDGSCDCCDLGTGICGPKALDVIAEPDHRRAEHMNRTLRRAEGGDEHA